MDQIDYIFTGDGYYICKEEKDIPYDEPVYIEKKKTYSPISHICYAKCNNWNCGYNQCYLIYGGFPPNKTPQIFRVEKR